ncbi:MAG: hypothetical protein NC213_03630 [Acetobacter sp.]|nr:hypothetical protein [Bacteroides sp.]MCM1340814.1 hypothetical protein [Acetobacter sp.]MCM1432629.1 hypothetical protein [Clostridiales bacterium]
MTKTKSIIILCFAILIVIFSGCSIQENDSKSELPTSTTIASTDESTTETVETTEKETITASETTTQKSESSDTTTTRPTEQKSAGQTTTRKVTTTQKSTTPQRQTTTKKVTTTQKPTTTKKVTTTAKTTTTSAPYWCDEGGTHHSCDGGQIGWVNSYAEASEKAYDYLGSHNETGNFRVKQCHGCGKFTAVITLD